ncbi:hypothetical protein OKA04_08345 [Luteolibacter flavescens]|uniref:DUF3592 domain-containing protein n=1 Tax=Luteolibacter flavescens TaxID=1859460 RepID=A0ABT3FMD2_9BACT|nr:hypothetical protein [Luteolibacter flavescens]MCW1884735.1 hypothetical protein [Luteolibacter flavescens]
MKFWKKQKVQPTRLTDWLFCGAMFLFAVGGLSLGEFNRRHGATREAELTEVSGLASDAEVSTVKGEYGARTKFLKFTVEGFRMTYPDDKPGYDRVFAAVESGTPVTVKVSTKRETVFPRDGWVPIYALTIGDDVVLTYQQTIAEKRGSSKAMHIFGGVLTVIAVYGLYGCYRNRPKTGGLMDASRGRGRNGW